MVKYVDIREREEEILSHIIESYIEESHPISSAYLCKKYNLSYSSATIRNVMLSLEKQGFLSHIHTSSGRVPTKKGFKLYVSRLKEENIRKHNPLGFNSSALADFTMDEVINSTLDTLTQFSGYTSLMAISGRNEKVFFRGMRFILEQPEFENIDILKHIFYILEVKMDKLGDLLFNCIDEKIQILIGDDIGFQEIADCSIIVSGLREKELSLAIALLGPMRMDYLRAASCIYSVKNRLKKVVEEFT